MVSTCNKLGQKGSSTLMAMFFVSLFSVLSLSFVSMSHVNVNMSHNHQKMSTALAAAESGLEYAKMLVNTYDPTGSELLTAVNTVGKVDAEIMFGNFVDHLYDVMNNEDILGPHAIYYNEAGNVLQVPDNAGIALSADDPSQFSLNLSLSEIDGKYHIVATSTGITGDLSRQVQISFPIQKDQKVLEYAIASRGRIWVTGDTTIEGDIFSDYDNIARSPFNMTDDSTVNGTLNTVVSQQDAINALWQMETLEPMLDEYGDPILDEFDNPVYGPVFDENGDRVYSPGDEVQGGHDGINYDQYSGVPGMDISDYDTDGYVSGLGDILGSSTIQTEYFPHAAGNYAQKKYRSSRTLNRHVYQNQTFTNAKLPNNRNALFINCTFDEVLYIDVNKSGSTNYNNVRFEDCTFNGTIVTDTPASLKWKKNALYFTGTATFQNDSYEATILAPHFNVNLGNTDPINPGESNQLNGAIIGGIVDVRGNAVVDGTIISMADTTQYTNGYVTNIGATLGDGGSETSEAGDVGTIEITPNPDGRLPSGLTTPVVISSADSDSYVEL